MKKPKYKLGEVISYKKGKKPNELFLFKEKNDVIPYLTADYLRGDNNPQWCAQNDLNITKVNESDIIMIWDGSNSGQTFTGFKGALASTMVKILPKKEKILHPNYLFYYLYMKSRFLNYATIGTGVPHVSKAVFLNLDIIIPYIDIQNKIAKILSNIDGSIKNIQRLIHNTTLLKQGLLQQLLSKGIGHTEFKETTLGRIPKNWEVKELGDIYKEIRGGTTPSRENPEYYNGNILWITSSELDFNIIKDTKEKITTKAVKDSNLKIYPRKTFVIAIFGLEAEGTRGRCAILGRDATINQACLAFSENQNIDPYYLFQYYCYYGPYICLKYSQGTKQQNLYSHTVKKIPIKIPPMEEQKTIAKILSDFDKYIQHEQLILNKFNLIKKGLMQQLLTGRIRVIADRS